MTLPTGVQAVAENNYGRPDKALDYLRRMTRSFSYALPGSMYEVSPDYGMIVQAWNIYAFAIPVIQQFFGILPNAAGKNVVFRPQMPSEWGDAKLENVKVAENTVSVGYKKTNTVTRITLQQLVSGWTMELQLPKDQNVRFEVVSPDVSHQSQNGYQVFTTGTQELILEIHEE